MNFFALNNKAPILQVEAEIGMLLMFKAVNFLNVVLMKVLFEGGGGGLAWSNNIAVVPGNQYIVTVGAGGTAGLTVNGGAGGNSSFQTPSGSVIGYGGRGGSVTGSAATGGNFSVTVGTIFGGGNGGGAFLSVNAGGSGGGGGAGGYSGVFNSLDRLILFVSNQDQEAGGVTTAQVLQQRVQVGFLLFTFSHLNF